MKKEWLKEISIGAAVIFLIVAFYLLIYNPLRATFFMEALFIFYGTVIGPAGIFLLRKKVKWKKERQIVVLFIIFVCFIILDITSAAIGISKFGLTRNTATATFILSQVAWQSPYNHYFFVWQYPAVCFCAACCDFYCMAF